MSFHFVFYISFDLFLSESNIYSTKYVNFLLAVLGHHSTVISIEDTVNQLKMKHGTVILIDLDTVKQLKCQHGTVFPLTTQ